MKKIYLAISILILFTASALAGEGIRLTFTRTGTAAGSVTTSITDENSNNIAGATASVTTTHDFKSTSNAVTQHILCPNINANQNPTIKLTFTITGLPSDFKFNKIGLDIHALNGGSNYQERGDGVTRQWNITAKAGETTIGTLNNIDIAAGVGSAGNVHQVWEIEKTETITANGSTTIELTITKGTTNAGCFFGLSEITLSNTLEEPTDTPEENNVKTYTISWKSTGSNYITEGTDQSLYIAAYNVTERQFWQFIPTENPNCYYIKNTATGRYIASCNKTPSSASRISTSATPVEYYVAPTSATSGEIAGCHYFSSTDCSNYDNEASGPRALNKDGASNYVITWQAGTSRTGSYWKLTETEDLYEIRPFEPSSTLGNVEVSYNISSKTRNITLSENDIYLADKNLAATNRGWYFVGNSNREGYLIASTSRPATTINIADGSIVAGETNATRWKVYATADASAYYFKSIDTGQTLIVDGDSLFNFSKQRNTYARNNKIYNNPCGYLSNNYITQAKLAGDDVLKTITYETTSAPTTWHKLYTLDRGEIAANGNFGIEITLAQTANEYLEIYAYFDWDTDGIFETAQQLQLNGNNAVGTFTVPSYATKDEESRMRVRVNENALNLAEDDVEGVVYDFIITVSEAMDYRTVTADVNAKGRGTVTLSATEEKYTPGSTLTATATPSGNNTFICWKEGNIIVSTDAEYTFTIDHNIILTAYFTPDTDGSDDITTSIKEVADNCNISISKEGNTLRASASTPIESITIYNSGAALVAKSNSDSISTANLANGIYIIKVRAREGEKNIKYLHNK